MGLRLEYLLFAGIAAILQRLPLGMVRAFARAAGRFAFSVLRVRRTLTVEHLQNAFPEWTREEVLRTARASYLHLITVIFEMMWTPRFARCDIERLLRVRNPEVIRAAMARGRGVILMSGHFGNWEWLSTGIARILDIPLLVIVHPMHNPRVDALVEGWRTIMGNRVVDMGISIRDVVRTLRARGIVAMLADQSGPSGSIYVPLFGRPAATYEGPASFALKTGAAIIFGSATRVEDGNYDVWVEEIPTSDLPDASDDSIRRLTVRHVRALERLVRRHPAQWLWQHKRWKHIPADPSLIATED